MEHLTPKVYDDAISADAAPTSGGNQLIKLNFQMLKAFCTVVQMLRNYHHSIANLMFFESWALFELPRMVLSKLAVLISDQTY